MTKRSAVLQMDDLIQENEKLRAENEQYQKRLKAAQDLLKSKRKECEKILVVFGDVPSGEPATAGEDPLKRWRPILDKAPSKGCGLVAQALADLGGRATIKQLVTASGYSEPTVRSRLGWLGPRGITKHEGREWVLQV